MGDKLRRVLYDGLLGYAIGDALGVPVEFMTREDLAQCPVTGFREYGTHNQPAYTWSMIHPSFSYLCSDWERNEVCNDTELLSTSQNLCKVLWRRWFCG